MNLDYYVLEGEIPRKAHSLYEWVTFMNDYRTVAQLDVDKNTFVSTVFLGIDHSFGLAKTPDLFETMAWYKGDDIIHRRYTTHEAAMTGHREASDLIKLMYAIEFDKSSI